MVVFNRAIDGVFLEIHELHSMRVEKAQLIQSLFCGTQKRRVTWPIQSGIPVALQETENQ